MSGPLDLLLAAGLLALAWVLLRAADLFRAIVFYVVFGLLMALVWARLGAVDVALVEAAVGAGVTGALFLAALSRIRFGTGEERRLEREEEATAGHSLLCSGHSRAGQGLVSCLILVLLGICGHALWAGPYGEHPLPAAVQEKLPASGVTNPVTAVLLNFRGYDTLLEIAVLFLAAVGVWAMRPSPLRGGPTLSTPIFHSFVRLITPFMVLFAGYLLWAGSFRPGGAFQAGSLLAAAGILLYLEDRGHYFAQPPFRLRLAMVMGLAVFLAVASWPLLLGRPILGYREEAAGLAIILIEMAATISIAVCLLVLFVQARPFGPEKED